MLWYSSVLGYITFTLAVEKSSEEFWTIEKLVNLLISVYI